MDDLIRRLRERKLVQWALAYVAAAFALIQVSDVVAQQFEWPDSVRRGVTIVLAVGFFVTLVLAWFHGERGAQRVSGSELMIVAMLLALGGGLLWRLAPKATPAAATAKPAPSAPPADRKSIAVLPFANLSADKDSGYFADGMRDMILTKLATIGDLKVISRTSTDKYANRPDDLKAVALQLGVASVLEGSVQKAGNQVLINLQLIGAADDQHLWAQAYKRTLDDIFGVEGEVAQVVAEALHARLSAAEQKAVSEKPTTNATAFDLFLRAEQARYAGEKSQSHASVNEAVALYERAVANDPRFALAWAELSYSRSWLYWQGAAETTPLSESARLALEAVERALALQPALSEANLAMGFYQYYVRFDLAQALVSFESALRAKPGDAAVLLSLGLITRRLGRFDESIDHLRAASRLDPRNQLVFGSLLITQVQTRRYSAAAESARRQLALDPQTEDALIATGLMKVYLRDDLEGAAASLKTAELPAVQVVRADLLRGLGRYDEAIEIIKAVPDTPENFSGDIKSRVLGTLYLESHDVEAARPLLLDAREKAVAAKAKVPDDHPEAGEALLRIALIDALLGDSDAAVGLAQRVLSLPANLPEKNYLGWIDVVGAAVRVYACARRADLAVPLLEKVLAAPGTGYVAANADLRLAPDFAPIRADPRFQALLAAHPGSGDVPE